MTACLNDFLLRAGWRPDANRTRRLDLALQGRSRAVEPFVVQPKSFLTGGILARTFHVWKCAKRNFFQSFPLRITSADFWQAAQKQSAALLVQTRFCGKSKAEKCVLQWTPASSSADTASLRMRTLKCILSISHPDGLKRVARQRLRGAQRWLGEEREGRCALVLRFHFQKHRMPSRWRRCALLDAAFEAPLFVFHSDHDDCLTRSKTGEWRVQKCAGSQCLRQSSTLTI
jgi:hypothetical protein